MIWDKKEKEEAEGRHQHGRRNEAEAAEDVSGARTGGYAGGV